ncbi:uncharacterized protein BDCG_00235 [Blastomyces dermatitidis ER-3]|uniref:PNPLA domain-containing protein n=1 Tax=Ajellomyces dermatitidis (strain ER-3 / ATCC MYA-2586) TaxID=559297 RepID=A0ABP2EK26_AJEDR|nr:uncharacterized protein BDCG_00235 [Blastomyces dermatitidis ER-3]EEQ83430.2 hypothetical protein BDCG_00235 [Blastomyces dermatitidis ER-3]EQL35972.1 hypothetical protein BDFG_02563 [Blastomyces dermatitidis ATCC 26199]
MDILHIRRKDTTKGPPLRILSLDGGGVRGYSMLILLQELMHRTYVECEGKAPARNQIPKPCDHFDLIAGTGTGGLIALMLGRLRLDLETCKDVYVRMTRRVFETDKTIAGIPYRSTLFKASKLEEAIRQCVWEHTVSMEEGNDGSPRPQKPISVHGPVLRPHSAHTLHSRTSRSSVSTTGASPVRSPASLRGSHIQGWGNADAILYDKRENRTKTAVAAVYKGTPMDGNPTLLRSYDSRKEPAPEFNCTIWQAGRATSATGLAFKPILVGQHVFIDEGAGKYNPAPMILDEAAVNEWPGREVGLFVSVGTGKRPSGTNHIQHEWWEDVFADSLGNFAEARRRLIAKIEGCEKIHQYMLKEHLRKRNVPLENYVRLNVEVGVGEFGMNEWNRLAEISTSTRTYLSRNDVQKMNQEAAVKLAKIHFIHRRLVVGDGGRDWGADSNSFEEGLEDGDVFQRQYHRPVPPIPVSMPSPHPNPRPPPPSTIEFPDAVELPGEDFIPFSFVNNNTNNSNPPPLPTSSYPQIHRTSSQEKYTVVTSDEHIPHPLNFSRKTPIPMPTPSSPTTNQPSPFTSQTRLNSSDHRNPSSRPQSSYNNPSASSPRVSAELFINPPPLAVTTTRPPSSHQNQTQTHHSVRLSHTPPLSPPPSHPPPPLPPKTPIPYPEDGYGHGSPSAPGPGPGPGPPRPGSGYGHGHGHGQGYAPAVMPIPPRAPNRPNSNSYGGLQSGNGIGIGIGNGNGNGNGVAKLPYPSDGPPPLVNKGRKPTYSRR